MNFWETDEALHRQIRSVEEKVLEAAQSRHQLLNQATTEIATAPGKRIRPALVLLASRYGPQPKESIIEVAAAMELLHLATLIHDDIIDETKLRKGIESTQSKFGKDVAVYAGDYLFTRCFQLLAEAGSTDQLEKVARAMTAICEGEVNQYADRYNTNPSVLNYLRKIHGKTATLFALATAAGATHSECDRETKRILVRFGRWFGMAFQIYDDILDLVASSRRLGKPVGNDLREGFYTLPVIYALRGNSGQQLRQLLEIGTKEAIQAAIDLIRSSNGLPQAEKVFRKYVSKAKKCLAQLPDNPSTETLSQLLYNAFPEDGNPLARFRIA